MSHTPWYNREDGILQALKSLKGFNELLSARARACYVYNDRLDDFIVLGRYSFDSCGNTSVICGENILKDMYPDIPDVLTREEVFRFMKLKGHSDPSLQSVMTTQDIPNHRVKCPICSRGWTMENIHDAHGVRKDDTILLDSHFIGKTLGELREIFSARRDALYRLMPQRFLQHPRFIDLSLKYPNAEEDWKKEIKVNDHGFVGDKEGIDDDYVICDGDSLLFSILTTYHKDCYKKMISDNEEQYMKDLFGAAGFQNISLNPTKNQYDSSQLAPPWFHVETEFGVFLVGQRRRVLVIDWSAILNDQKSSIELLPLFDSEEVTKEKNFIHAWSKKDAVYYLTRIRKYLRNNA